MQDSAYAILGVSSSATDAEIKKVGPCGRSGGMNIKIYLFCAV
jgi:hypothetical protein